MRSCDNNPHKILVIRTDRIGDVVLTTPALRALRRCFPEARISLLVTPATLDLVRGHPDVDEVLVDDRSGRHAGVPGFWRLLRDIRRARFDVVINFHPKKRTNLLSFFSGIPRRIGYANDKFGCLLTDRVPDIRPHGQKHEARYCLELLESLGVSPDQELLPRIVLQQEAQQQIGPLLESFEVKSGSEKIIALHLGASCPSKRWPVRYFADVVRGIAQRVPAVFCIVGTPDQRDLATALRTELGSSAVVHDMLGRTSVALMCSLINRCDLLISNDSGPVHVAAALGVPVISIFTRNQPGINPERWRPLGPKSHYLAPPLDLRPDFSRGRPDDRPDRVEVQPQQVLDLVDALF